MTEGFWGFSFTGEEGMNGLGGVRRCADWRRASLSMRFAYSRERTIRPTRDIGIVGWKEAGWRELVDCADVWDEDDGAFAIHFFPAFEFGDAIDL